MTFQFAKLNTFKIFPIYFEKFPFRIYYSILVSVFKRSASRPKYPAGTYCLTLHYGYDDLVSEFSVTVDTDETKELVADIHQKGRNSALITIKADKPFKVN